MRVIGRKMRRVMKEERMWYLLRMRNPIMHLGDLEYHYVISFIFMFTHGTDGTWCP